MTGDKQKRLKEDILGSGLPLEIEVSTNLRERGWFTVNQYPYSDKDEKTIRTIDVRAFSPDEAKLQVSLLIECKKSTDHPWVFYSESKKTRFYRSWSFADVVDEFVRGTIKSNRIGKCHLLDTNVHLGIIGYVPFRKRDDFFEARMQVLSAKRNIDESEKKDKKMPKVNYPVIVFDGDMYATRFQKGATRHEKEELELWAVNYLHFICTDWAETGTVCFIDVMRKHFFPEFLTEIDLELELRKR